MSECSALGLRIIPQLLENGYGQSMQLVSCLAGEDIRNVLLKTTSLGWKGGYEMNLQGYLT